ncbi:DMT family transporter [Rhodobacteraceae bacterium]|nr:DMT family transporter [Paracoccaceae bacterium]
MVEAPTPQLQTPETGQNPLAGILWMVLTGFFFVGVTAAVKYGATELPAAMSAFLRYVLGPVIMLPILGALRNIQLTKRQMRLFALRGFVHSLGVFLWFYAMTRITIAEVTAMNYMTPIYITLAAALFLGERVAKARFIAIGIAFVGALIILRPGRRELSDGHLAMVFNAIFFAIGYLAAKRMADELPASIVVAMLSITVTIGLFPMALFVWQWPTAQETGWMFLVAVMATAGHYSMTRAFAAAPVSVTQPITFLQLIWSVLVGYFLFAETVDFWVIFGGSLIVLAASFIAIREAMLKRRMREKPVKTASLSD